MRKPLELLADSWEIDAQTGSPLFDGTIPAEIRLEIFRYALTPYNVICDREDGGVRHDRSRNSFMDDYWDHDFRVQSGHDGDVDSDLPADLDELPDTHETFALYAAELSWCRPGCRGRPVLSINLLASCRRAFIEARPFCFQSERWWWWWAGPWYPYDRGWAQYLEIPQIGWHPPGFSGRALDSWSREKIEWEQRFRSARIVGHPGFPSDNYLLGHRHPPPFLKLQHLRFTIPKSGMDGSFVSEKLVINPFGAQTDMKKAMRLSKDFTLERALKEGGHGSPTGRPAWMPPGLGFDLLEDDAEFQGPWGRKFVNLPELRTLTIDFDIDEHCRKEMDAIVEWAARAWQLPLNPNINGGYHYLSAHGNPIAKIAWRGSLIHQACLCGSRRLTCHGRTVEHSKEIVRRAAKGLGCRMYTWTVTWTRRRHDGPEIYPYNGAVGVREDDLRSAEYEEGKNEEGSLNLYLGSAPSK